MLKQLKQTKNFKTATIKSNVGREWSPRMSSGREMNYSILMDFLIEVNFFKWQNLYKTVAGSLQIHFTLLVSLIKLSKHDVMFQMTRSAHPLPAMLTQLLRSCWLPTGACPHQNNSSCSRQRPRALGVSFLFASLSSHYLVRSIYLTDSTLQVTLLVLAKLGKQLFLQNKFN